MEGTYPRRKKSIEYAVLGEIGALSYGAGAVIFPCVSPGEIYFFRAANNSEPGSALKTEEEDNR